MTGTMLDEPGTNLTTSTPTGLINRVDGGDTAFSSRAGFDEAVPIAKALAASTLVPDQFRNNVPNCLIAMELAGRTRASVFMCMQNLHIIKGRPSWSSMFLIASVNSCGRFSPLRFESEGTESTKGWRCRAFSTERRSGDKLVGQWITWDMVLGEGWWNKDGSKWKTMPGQMIMYRAAAFWVRIYAPEISLGMQTADEVEDVIDGDDVGVGALNQALRVEAPEPAPLTFTSEATRDAFRERMQETPPVEPKPAKKGTARVADPELEAEMRRQDGLDADGDLGFSRR